MQASVIYTPLHDKKFLLKFFLDGSDLKFKIGHKGKKYSLRNTSRMQNIEFVGYFSMNIENLVLGFFFAGPCNRCKICIVGIWIKSWCINGWALCCQKYDYISVFDRIFSQGKLRFWTDARRDTERVLITVGPEGWVLVLPVLLNSVKCYVQRFCLFYWCKCSVCFCWESNLFI